MVNQTPLTDWSSEGTSDLYMRKEQYVKHAIQLDVYVSEMDKRVRMMMPEDV